MALNTHQQKALSDREYNSNYLNERHLMARPSSDRDASSDSFDGSGRLSKRASTKHLPTSKSATKVFLNYNHICFDNAAAKAKRTSQYCSTSIKNNTPHFDDKDDSSSLCFSEDSYSCDHTRLVSGANRTQKEVDKLIVSPSQCKVPADGLGFEPKKQVNLVHLQLSDSHTYMNLECRNPPLPHVIKSNTRGTQSLYRESSAQTLPYLPGVINDPKELETLEVFKLPTILPGDGKPGLYEVEVLERARKRWAFAKAVKENFRKRLQEAREQAKLRQNDHVLEAFEWEHWLEREEYIQECQMIRLESLILMFDKREREMHTASQVRIEKSCKIIEARRQVALKKNDIAHARALRRLEIKHVNQPRVWRKEHISQGLGDPSSEFYAPKMRNGVNPSRRHFQASRKDFNMRMHDLEKTAVKMDYKHLKCPFSKLNEWSKPKEVTQEVEQNFCSEGNLKKLYESMRTLRESSLKQKTAPLCLKAKVSQKEYPKEVIVLETPIEENVSEDELPIISVSQIIKEQEEAEHKKSMEELRKQKTEERQRIKMLQREMQCEELETIINTFEGGTIGWLMRFLYQEMCRLMEQRKLHFFTMMAKRERWHREAAEAGLRQKENKLREEFDELYLKCDQTNINVSEKFFSDLAETDILDYAEEKAEADITDLARKMDNEITIWLETVSKMQDPLNYETLRYALLDIFMPNRDKILHRLEIVDCINYIINDVLLDNVNHLLEKYDVSFAITSDLIDRLIDNDMHLDSPECSSECACECTSFCICTKARNEAMAIIRKAIRRAVPGRRWSTPHERIAFENIRDLLDDVFDQVIPKSTIVDIDMKTPANVDDNLAHTDLVDYEHDIKYSDPSEKSRSPEGSMFKLHQICSPPKSDELNITKNLEHNESLLLMDPDKLSADRLLIHENAYTLPHRKYSPTRLIIIPSNHNIRSSVDFSETPVYNQTTSDEIVQEEAEEIQSENEELYEILSRTENWVHEISSPHHDISEENQEEDEEEFHSDQEEIYLPVDSTVLESKLSDDIEEDVSSGVMAVSFSYSPLSKYTIAITSSYRIAPHKSLESITELEEVEETEEKIIETV